MDYRQARAFLNEISSSGSVYGLDSIRGLMARLGNVQEQLTVIHVAGTNGKGSVCAMLAGVLQEAGYRIGIYASPAVFEPEEIIRVNGTAISQEAFAKLTENVQAACLDMQKEGLPHPTVFEVETAIAFCFFKQENCDAVVLETGLGGTQDATNLITRPFCSVLTSISMDHMQLLGQTLEEIAAAKAGIMKSGCPCVSAPQQPEVEKVLRKAAEEKGAAFYMADSSCISSFCCQEQTSSFELQIQADACGCQKAKDMPAQADACGYQKVHGLLGLAGACQKENLACVLETLRVLKEQGLCIPREAMLTGLERVRLPGRFEKISSEPDFYIDGAHNEGAARFLKKTVQSALAGRRVVYIIGVFADKEYEKLLRIMLPYAAQVFCVTPDHPRALDGKKLAQLAEKLHPAVTYVPDILQAAASAAQAAGREGAVLAFGSFSYLGELKAGWNKAGKAGGNNE